MSRRTPVIKLHHVIVLAVVISCAAPFNPFNLSTRISRTDTKSVTGNPYTLLLYADQQRRNNKSIHLTQQTGELQNWASADVQENVGKAVGDLG